MRRWIRALLDRFRPAEMPQEWDEKALADIKPIWNQPLDGDEDTAVVIVVDEHLGPLDVIEPVPALLFEKVRELHSVDLSWRPAWLDWAVA